MKGTRHYSLYELHRKYGRFVRCGPNHMSICSTTALETIYGHRANVQKSSWYSAFFGQSIFNVVDKSVHARKKRVMSQAFSEKAVKGMEPHILSAIRTWTSTLRHDPVIDGSREKQQDTNGGNTKPTWSTSRDMAKYSAYMVFDVLGEILLGETFYSSEKIDNRDYLVHMDALVRSMNLAGQAPIINKLNLGPLFSRGSKQLRQEKNVFTQRQMKKRLALSDKTDRKDIVYYLQQARDPETGEGYPTSELIFETTLLLGAGSDTATTGLAATFYFLAHHPDVLTRLTETIRTTFPDVESIVGGPALYSLTYLRACVDESLRLCPPIPALLPREVLPGGMMVDGQFFPAGTILGVPTYAMHHSSDHFDKPFVYDPGRWLLRGTHGVREDEGHTQEEVAEARKAFNPFSTGPRACIGRNVALLELYVGIARTLWLYDIRLTPGTENVGVGKEGEYSVEDYFIVGKAGPILQFRPAD